ncbi:MAG: response regulator [Desulfobacteraceae bacterium]|nr:MAG: response regulator [Desulfobacteraceae bacterium]
MESRDKKDMDGQEMSASAYQVLVVEDDEGLNKLAQKSLRRAGFDCQGALTGAEAISKIKENPELVLLIDQRLPDMDGSDLVRLLAEAGFSVPFVTMTGHGDERTAVDMMKLGARDYLTKGVDLTDILPMVFKRLFHELETEKKLKNAEQTLLENQALYKSLLETTKAIAYEMDLSSFKFTYISPQILEITGFPAEIWTDFDFWANTIHPDDRTYCINFCKTETQEGRDHQFEYRMLREDGQVIWINDLVSLVKKDGKAVALRGFLFDITEQKNMETQLQQTQKMEAIGNLSGGIAHDFNNILFPIVGMSELLIDDLDTGSPEHHYACEIFKAGQRGSDLVKQILAFSRQTEHRIIPTKIQSVLKEVLKLTRATIPSNIEISSDIQFDCGLAMADPTQIHQVAMNLITNAYHAVEEKNGKIRVQLKQVSLGVADLQDSLLSPGKYVKMSISDNGKGIHPSSLDKIFEPYFTTKEKDRGTGLGLSVVYGIVKEHKGEIKVRTELHKGSEFIVYFPLAGKPVLEKKDKPEAGPQGMNERIILVDDDASVLQLVSQILERLGYRVQSFPSSDQALRAFQSAPNHYDLVLTDMTMPGMTGDMLAKRILAIREDVPIIICTGFSERINEDQAKALGVKGLLMKPVVKSDMAKMVRKALDENQSQRTG